MTLASGLVAAIPQIAANPGSTVTLLATQLPAASTFFLTYFVTSSLAAAAGGLLRIVPLIIYYVKLFILGSTPRAVFGIKFGMGGVAWGTLFPNMTLLTVIGELFRSLESDELQLTRTSQDFLTRSSHPSFPALRSSRSRSSGSFTRYVVSLVDRKGTAADGSCSTSSSGSWTFPPRARPVDSSTPRLSRTSLSDSTSVSGAWLGVTCRARLTIHLRAAEEICLTGLFFLAQDADGKQSAIPQGAFSSSDLP